MSPRPSAQPKTPTATLDFPTRRGSGLRRTLIVLAPVTVAGLAAMAIGVISPRLLLKGQVSLWLLVLEAGAAISLAVGVATWMSARAARAAHEAARMASASGVEQAQGDHRRFVARLDHELKNPVTAIRVGIANLRATIDPKPGEPSSDLLASLASLDAQAVRLSRLTGDLRKLTAVEVASMDESVIEPSELLRDVVDDAREVDQPQPGSVSVELVLPRRPWPLPAIVGDRDLLHVALLNLVTNAVKFSPRGGTVEVRAQDEPTTGVPRWLIVEVSDGGIGIPADELPIIWDELARGRGATGLPGSGIGLALVRTIITRHRGEIMLGSIEGQGTVVTVRLPVQDTAGAGPGTPLPDLRQH